MRNGSVFFKSAFYLPLLAFSTVLVFTSCTHTSTSSSTYIGDWARVSDYGGAPRTQAFSFTIGNTEYIGGGYNGTSNTRLNNFFRFDEPNWSPDSSFIGDPRNGAAGFSINGKGYVVGGYDGTNYLNDFWQFDPTSTSPWTQLPSLPQSFTPRFGAVGFSLTVNGTTYGYVATGIDSLGDTYNDIWRYDPGAGTWTAISNFKRKRAGAAVFIYQNQAYLVGGIDNGSYIGDLEVFDPNTSTVSNKRDIINENDSSYDVNYGFNITRSNTAAFLINDTAYVATGNYNSIIGTCWAYDITNDQWFQKTTFEGPAREGAVGFSVNNHGYVTTGDNNSSYYDDTWEFFPDATQTTSDNQ